ncbi:TetR family transcriptional regulator [Novosphingobium sp. CF614]|uniref:TetR family transcriptional regulator n=1 Tax=Novosphingobium sp. CF614 TaxID=1884364 RepID=UPI0015A6B488|nr:TetR family transcriptional regulator [Novosphingobium sp. CF614]
MSLQVTFHQVAPGSYSDMRSRKKARTRLAIQDAALDLFADQGYDETTVEQIALRADVSASTFFRYFGSKADIILNDYDSQLGQLCAAVRDQPLEIRDLEAVRRALQATWVPYVDPVRTIRTERAVARSAFLCGVAYNIGRGWMDAVAAALVERRGDPDALEECLLIARTALGVFGGATEQWVSSEAKEDFGALIDQGFEMLQRMCRG